MRVLYSVRIVRSEETVAVCGLDASSSGQGSVEGGATLLKYSVRRVATDKIGCRVIHRLLEYCPMKSICSELQGVQRRHRSPSFPRQRKEFEQSKVDNN